jgi:hypothetical protein
VGIADGEDGKATRRRNPTRADLGWRQAAVTRVFERVKPASAYERIKDEAYPTPPWAVRAVLPYVPNDDDELIWEPAAGAGRLARALRRAGRDVVATRGDFLKRKTIPQDAMSIVTNPPYGKGGRLAVAFIEQALTFMHSKQVDADICTIAMLLRIDFDSGSTRTHLFRDCRQWSRKVVLLDRVLWFPNADGVKPSTNHAWYIWSKYRKAPPVISYAGREHERS